MSLIINPIDTPLKDALIGSEAISASAFQSMTHPKYQSGEMIRLPELMATNCDRLNEELWMFSAIQRYAMLHIPSIHLSLQDNLSDQLDYDLKEELFSSFYYPLGISNGAIVVVTGAPHIALDDDVQKALARHSPLRKIQYLLLSFRELGPIQNRSKNLLI